MTKANDKPTGGAMIDAPKPEPTLAAVDHKDGIAAAEAHLVQFDEDVTLLWDVNGPKRSRIARIGQFLVAPNGAPPVKLLCLAMVSGAFQMFAPANIAPPPKGDALADAEQE